MSRALAKFRSRAMFTFVGGALVINPAFAQDAAPATGPQPQSQSQPTQLDAVQVTGIRNSLSQAMDIKRDSAGVVDAISAEDIGKFPDTNLAESLQRITGISIERRDGEGAQVTARGFGPQFNMVTLNGRQMPGADAFGASGQVAIGGVDGGTRAFNFAQLAAEAINGIEVYKTSQAQVPSGGIGATINILTSRPLDHAGIVASAGAKLASDQSQPFDNDLTPELSGIFSYSNPEKTFGVSLSASQQKRKGGSVQATENYWNVQPWTGSMPGNPTVVNAPAVGQLYARPNDLRYAFSEFERERVNGQAVLQFAPTDSLTLTVDYTYSTNEITENRGEQGMWLQNSNYTNVEFDTSGAIATPVYIREIAGTKDFGLEQQRSMQEYKLGSLGFNAVWNVSDRFKLSFDAHNSKNESRPNDPLTGGGSIFMSIAGTNNCTRGPHCGGSWVQELNFNNGLPVGTQVWYPSTADAVAGTNGVVNPGFQEGEVGTQVLRVNAQTQISEIKQARVDGEWNFDHGRFQFGVDTNKSTTHRIQAAEAYSTLGDWGVANVDRDTAAGLMDLLQPVSIVGLFDDYSANSWPAWRGNAGQLAQWASREYGVGLGVNPQRAADNFVEEKTKAAYFQVELDGELGGMRTNTRLGVRYETTDVVSTSVIAVPESIERQANNDFRIVLSDEQQPFTEKARYSYILPNLDFSIDLTEELKGRVSFGKSIARAPYGNLYAGPGAQQPFGSVLIDPSSRASGNSQNPSLKPLESDNLDLGLEWYFADASYVSLTYWNKSVSNFIGNTVVQESLYGLTDPTSGPDARAALDFLTSGACVAQVGPANAAACSANDTSLFTALALLRNNPAGLGAYNGTDAQVLATEAAYDLYGQPNDPLYQFNVNRPINQNKSKLHGWELGGQYFFGDTGFGVLANYTVVKGDVGYNNGGDPGIDQFSLTGLSDTANAMLMYEKYGWSVRLAWNWRDQYLILANQGSSRNPYYVEPYEQWDLSVNYALDDHWSFSLEAINLTGEDVRWRSRTSQMIVKLADQSPRYMLGVRYKF
ncbi:TonB-dependent receptor [Stenotrophomonas maltophilia]|uniref:TonB-dependent receptor n=1 Tax=Stenotrophomonas maltophilia TaxID=40324 RepID=A0AAX1IB82_STEMA|nr:TonB-dependent receptor [Stenotrophomonas maltophilia]QGL80667.1 TonB-dependent receptor [Stenotrophomonas maltophilia]QNG75941.1 TonB-dependent receptor [Stenotrophomonas maltophilia]